MNGIDKLQIGKTYKYKELCALLGEAEKSSNSKNSQLKIWACYFRWSHPKKTLYLIEEIYPTPLPIVDGRKNNGGNSTSKYLLLDDLIMDYLETDKEVFITVPKLAVEIGILTKQYRTHRYNIKKFCTENDIPVDIGQCYLAYIDHCVLEAIKSSLNRLHQKSYIEKDTCITLFTKAGKEIELSKAMSDEVTSMEKQILHDMGITYFEMLSKGYSFEVNSRVQKLLLELYDYDIARYYRKYRIIKTNTQYVPQSTEDKWRLSRKFIITIGHNMLKTICTIDDGDACEQTELIQKTIELTNYFFVYMNHDSWNAYWNDDELDWKNEDKAMLFWSQYCLVEYQQHLEKKQPLNNRPIIMLPTATQKHLECRAEAMEILGEDVVLECEYILPELNWVNIVNDGNYAKAMANAIDEYYVQKELMHYCTNEPVEEYSLYLARFKAQNEIDEPMSLFEFKESLNTQD